MPQFVWIKYNPNIRENNILFHLIFFSFTNCLWIGFITLYRLTQDVYIYGNFYFIFGHVQNEIGGPKKQIPRRTHFLYGELYSHGCVIWCS